MVREIVLTGGASCGKTSVIDVLKAKGFGVLEETAMEVLKEFQHLSMKEKQIEIFKRQLEKEKNVQGDIVFMDRSLIDVICYSKMLFGKIPDEMNLKEIYLKYDKVFVLNRLEFVKNDVRIESGKEEAKKSHESVIDAYKQFGIEFEMVPVMSVEERVGFILKRI